MSNGQTLDRQTKVTLGAATAFAVALGSWMFVAINQFGDVKTEVRVMQTSAEGIARDVTAIRAELSRINANSERISRLEVTVERLRKELDEAKK